MSDDQKAIFSRAPEIFKNLRREIDKVIVGQNTAIEQLLVAILAGGHALLESNPGLAKTLLVKTTASCLGLDYSRIQCTPDLMPADITGTTIIEEMDRGKKFRFEPGPVFSNIVLTDEINRASPKTQSALLECMEERQVTVDATTYELASPFMVMATQNPVEMEGTYPLPEAQRDRFMARVSMGYPDPRSEIDMLAEHAASNPLDSITPVADAALISRLVEVVRTIHVADSVRQYAVDIANATRTHGDVRLGASPRATLHLVRAAKASAALDDRDHVLPDDLQALAPSVLAHRLILTADAQIAGRTTESVVTDILGRLAVPATARV